MTKDEFPINLLKDIFGEIDFELPEDILGTTLYVLGKLKKKEYTTVIYRYMYGKTLEECGVVFNISRQAVNFRLVSALMKLRASNNKDILKLGLNYYTTATTQNLIHKCYMHLEEGKSLSDLDTMHLEDIVFKITIEELDLNVRTYNCLKRARLNTIGDIVKLDSAALLKLRNFGKGSYNNLVKVLCDYGILIYDYII